MPDKWPLANGNWSNAANWNGGTKPIAGDDVFADGFTIAIDESVTVRALCTTQRSGGTEGGGFTCSLAGVVVNANVVSGTTRVLRITNSTGVVTLNGDVTASATNSVTAVVKDVGAGAIVHNGNSIGGAVLNAIGLQISGTGSSFTGTGNYAAGAGSNSFGLQVANTASHTVTGNALGGALAASGILIQAAATFVLNGNCVAAGGSGLIVSGAATVTISGSVTGGSGPSARGVSLSAAGSVTVAGNATGGTNPLISATCFGAYNSTGTLAVQGHAIGAPSGGSVGGVFGALGATTTVGSVRVSATGVAGIAGRVFVANLATTSLQAINAALTIQTYQSGGLPRPDSTFSSQLRPTSMQAGGSVFWTVYTFDPDAPGRLRNADFLPTIAVRRNGMATADAVTVTKRAATTGIYDCSYNPAGEAAGEQFTVEESATVTGSTTPQALYSHVWAFGVSPVQPAIVDANLVAIEGDNGFVYRLNLALDEGVLAVDKQTLVYEVWQYNPITEPSAPNTVGDLLDAKISTRATQESLLQLQGNLQGTGFSSATDSLAAIREAVGDGISVNVLPLNTTLQSRVSGSTIEVFWQADSLVALGITDAAGVAVDLEELTLEFVVESRRSRTDKLVIADGDLVKSGSTLNVTIPKSAANQLGQKKWALWDKTAEDVLAHGLLIVNYAPKADD